MTALAPLLVALTLLLALGAALLDPSIPRRALRRSRRGRLEGRGPAATTPARLDPPLALSAWLAIGLAVATPVTVAAGLAGWPVGAWAFGSLLAVLAGGAWVFGLAGRVPVVTGGSGDRPSHRTSPAPAWLRWTAAAALALAAGVLLWKLLLVPVWSWDHLVIWGLKARRLATAGSLDLGFLAAPELARSNPHYPLGLPVAWLLLSLGTVPGEALFKAAHLLFAAGLLASVRSAAARLGESFAVGNVAAAFVAVSPLLWDTNTLGLAEVPLAFFATTSVALLLAATEGGTGRNHRLLLAAGLLAGFLPWVKDDGLPLALLLVALAAVWTVGAGAMAADRSPGRDQGALTAERALETGPTAADPSPPRESRAAAWAAGNRRFGLLAAFAVPALLLTAGALLVERFFLPPGMEFLTGDWPARVAQRLAQQRGEIVGEMAGELTAPDFLGLWLAFPVAALLTLRRRHRRALPLAVLVLAQLGLYLVVFFATVLPPLDHVRSALYRIAATLVPLAVLPLAALARTRKDDAGQGRVPTMSPSSQSPASGPFAFVSEFASRLRYPQLFFLTAGLFVLDLMVPDFIPFADEILLGLLTLLLGRLKNRRTEPDEPRVKNVTPEQ